MHWDYYFRLTGIYFYNLHPIYKVDVLGTVVYKREREDFFCYGGNLCPCETSADISTTCTVCMRVCVSYVLIMGHFEIHNGSESTPLLLLHVFEKAFSVSICYNAPVLIFHDKNWQIYSCDDFPVAFQAQRFFVFTPVHSGWWYWCHKLPMLEKWPIEREGGSY